MNRVKIIATVGPATKHPEILSTLREAGMDVARLNGAHADLGWHNHTISLLREILPDVPILLDIPGRKIRTGRLDPDLSFAQGEIMVFTNHNGQNSPNRIPVAWPGWPKGIRAGMSIFVDDGTLRFTVLDIVAPDVICRAENAGTIRSGKGINIPGIQFQESPLTDRDRELIQLALRKEVDFVGLSFADNAAQVQSLRTLLGKKGPRVVAKIETQNALDELGKIMRVSDALMIDRGDLSVETNLERVTLLQKHILAEGQRAACPVIVATEMLHSMIANPIPTKAEVSDITNAVLEGAAALMLSGETTVGKFPVEAVRVMRRVANTASEHLQDTLEQNNGWGKDHVPEAIGDAIALICRNLKITKIVAITLSGYAARMIAARIPRQPILAVSNDPTAARCFNLLRGAKGIWVDIPVSRTSLEHIPRFLEALWQKGELADEDLILVTAVSYPKSGNRMNLIETHQVADLRENLGWKNVQSTSIASVPG